MTTLSARFSRIGTIRRLPSGLALLAMLALSSASGQASRNTCGLIGASKYPVGATCAPIGFNKPESYTRAYTPGGCNASNNDDAYGWFQATSTLTTVRYTPQSNRDGILHVLAACGGTVLGCSDVLGNGGAETVTISTVIGVNYFVRVQRRGSNGAMDGTLCIFNPTCLYRLTLNDSYGDGWGDTWGGQAYVDIRVNGTSLGLYTMYGGSSGYVDFPVVDGDVIEVIFGTTGGGGWIDENSFTLSVGGQCVLASGAPPTLSAPYTVTANCTATPTALPQDCAGGTTICGDQSITSNSTSAGCVADLNSSNKGCLLSTENQGTWYYFSPSASGTLGFTITPQNSTDDYDFALWGPYDNVQCPTGPPARCSYYDGAYYNNTTTGMGNGAYDASEGAYNAGFNPWTNPNPPGPVNGWVKTAPILADKVYVLYIDNYSSTGQAFDLTWQLTNGASLDCTTLPMELISLEATARKSVIDVSWATATEQSSNYFMVERSPDNETFTPIGTVAAAGDAQYRNDYLFTDIDPFQGANYYRLKQVDYNGEFKRTHTVVAFMGGTGNRPVIFPNPATEVLNVAFSTPLDGSAVLYVQDALGRTIAESTVVALRGEQTTVIPTDNLARGWYNLTIALPDGSVLPGGGFLKK